MKNAMCDRECRNCLKRRTCEWQDGGARIGGCMEFTPDMAIPEVAEAESKNGGRMEERS